VKRFLIIIASVLLGAILIAGLRAFLIARSETASNACLNNLREIDAAKNQWKIEKGKTTNDSPTWDDIRPYISRTIVCPQGGTYSIGKIGEPPTCSIGGRGHSLPKGEGQ
jgi:hypothetical protein